MAYRLTKRAAQYRGRVRGGRGSEGAIDVADWREPELRRLIIVIDLDSGRPIINTMALHRTRPRRVDCYDVYIHGRLWAARMGWSRALASVRKAFPRVMRPRDR
jgi:hypothetical protein